MGSQIGIVIIEPRSLVREALAALMTNLSYAVICSVESTAHIIGSSIIADEPKLIILGTRSAEDGAEEAIKVRKLWPDSKIMLLFEGALSGDLHRLLASQIDGLVPLFVSADTLSSMLDLIITKGLRVMIAGDAKHSTVTRFVSEEPQALKGKADKFLPSVVADDATSGAADTGELAANDAGSGNAILVTSAVEKVPPNRNLRLSEREAQILNGVVKGHANKVIARTFDISEATVKVHMKSILRKIRVANRTQAAIWAMANGYCADEVATRPKVRLVATKEGHSSGRQRPKLALN